MSKSEIHPSTPPVLSTPESNIFEDPTPPIDPSAREHLPDEELNLRYEIRRTIQEIREGRWRRVALQFEDRMLGDAVRVYGELGRGLRDRSKAAAEDEEKQKTSDVEGLEIEIQNLAIGDAQEDVKLFILADTSYGACCVDEVAAEHVDADVVVHYGRSCLSPTARLPVIYVFTTRPLDIHTLVDVFKTTYKDKEQKVILMADIPYTAHMPAVFEVLKGEGFSNLYQTTVIHDPSSPLPNRTVPDDVQRNVVALRDYKLFHIGQPPTALLLILSSRAGSIHIYSSELTDSQLPRALLASSALALRRRYALITSLSTVSMFGILINTLSVKNYLHIVDHVKEMISAAGKKHYTFVVGKINAAKLANFSEVGGWVVVGCWESSLVESAEFYKPLITPFELQLTLQADKERIWTGEWTSDFQAVLRGKESVHALLESSRTDLPDEAEGNDSRLDESDEESAPPEFDLRTGRYVSHSRPMRTAVPKEADGSQAEAGGKGQLVKRANGAVAQIGGVASPGAEFLRSNRTWQGLGSDFEVDYTASGAAGALVEQGRSGIARGYTAGEEQQQRR